MVWMYFDESGEHSPNGTLRRLTLGCGIAPLESWRSLTPEWREVLDAAGAKSLHMKHFEARRGEYEGWSDEKRRSFLNDLLDVASRHVPMFCGYSGSHRNIVGKGQFRKAYRANLIKSLKETVLRLDDFGVDQVNLFFAQHNDISAKLIDDCVEFFNYWAKGRIANAGFGRPNCIEALQVADLTAYEFSRTAREVRPEGERYPLRTLASRAKAFLLYQAEEFDSVISVWGRKAEELSP